MKGDVFSIRHIPIKAPTHAFYCIYNRRAMQKGIESDCPATLDALFSLACSHEMNIRMPIRGYSAALTQLR